MMIKIKSIMSKNVITIPKDSNIKDAAKTLTDKTVTSLIVVDNGEPIGILTERAAISAYLLSKKKVSDVMEREFTVVSPSDRFSQVNKVLMEQKIKIFPVVENQKLVGLVTETDMIEATRDFTRMHQIVQDTILFVFGLATLFSIIYFSPLKHSIFG